MKPKRRTAPEGAHTRAAILDAAEDIMREEGYAAVSSRRVAQKAGLKSQLVHYHFGTMDELFQALMDRAGEEYLARRLKALTSSNPLRAFWDVCIDPKSGVLTLEFIALANHRKVLRDQLARSGERVRQVEEALLAKALEDVGVDPADFPPTVLSLLMAGVSRSIVTEAGLGLTARHADMLAYADRLLRKLESRADKTRKAAARRGRAERG
jgi:AcrR family transcriptional regulator